MKVFTSKNQKIGLIGEKIAEMFLVKQGFSIIDRNFSSRFGEIDIIGTKDSRLYFFEIKTITVSHETNIQFGTKTVSRETFILENRKLTNPFQNISKSKIRRLLKTIQIYLVKNNVPYETRWQADGIGVFLDENHDLLKIEHLPNIGIL